MRRTLTGLGSGVPTLLIPNSAPSGVLVLLFGAKRLPDAARSLGRSARILKAEVHEAGTDGKAGEPAQTPSTETAAPAPAVAVEPAVSPQVDATMPPVVPPAARMSA